MVVVEHAAETPTTYAAVQRIVQDHGGSVEVRESQLGGARVELRLPAA